MAKIKTPLSVRGAFDDYLGFLFGFDFVLLIVVWWDNDLREIVVPDSFLFLSTLFVQALRVSYIIQKIASILLCLDM
jgi:hypothetical protein